MLHRLVTVLDALDTQVPIPLWEAASRTPQPTDGHLPATGVLAELKVARDKRMAPAAISDLDTYTVLSRFAVDRTGMQVKRLDMIIQWQNGRKEIVWPEEIHTSSAIFGKAVP